jgi:hypothetical protein
MQFYVTATFTDIRKFCIDASNAEEAESRARKLTEKAYFSIEGSKENPYVHLKVSEEDDDTDG